VKSLSCRGLSFRGHNDKFGSAHSGNFIMFGTKSKVKEILSDYLTNSKNKTVKRLSDTRWAARHEACASLSQNWTELLKAFNGFVENPL